LRDSVLLHISLSSDGESLQVARWRGYVRLRAGKLQIDKGMFVSPVEPFEISGSASLARLLDLKLSRGPYVKTGTSSLVYSITGTVAEPRVAIIPTPETQAQLKP
jgi:hypothetical protein